VTCGHSHSLALDDKGQAYTWGNGNYGKLGHKVRMYVCGGGGGANVRVVGGGGAVTLTLCGSWVVTAIAVEGVEGLRHGHVWGRDLSPHVCRSCAPVCCALYCDPLCAVYFMCCDVCWKVMCYAVCCPVCVSTPPRRFSRMR
jgi:hypothetical protein